jgi:hypothetical protein
MGAVPGQLVELGEGALVEQQRDPLAGGQPPPGVLLFHRHGRPRVHRLMPAPLKVSELARRGVRIRRGPLSRPARNRIIRGHGERLTMPTVWLYHVVVRLTSWHPPPP